MNLQILYEDDKMLVCNKPTGVLAQSGKSFDVDMVSALMTYRKKKGEDTFIGVINRLDRQVSGLMIFAKTKNEAAKLNKLMQQNLFDKQYYAVIYGIPSEEKGIFVDYLLKDGKNNTASVVEKEVKDAKYAKLEYQVIKSITEEATGLTLTLVRIHLITGRHHQIRVQFSHRGLGLVGDTKYGNGVNVPGGSIVDSNLDKNGIALCAYSLQVGNRLFEIEPEDDIFKQMNGFK